MRGRLWLVFGIFGLLILAACVSLRPRPPAIVWPSATPAPIRGPLLQEQGAGTPIPARQIMIPLYQYPKRYLTPAATDTWTLAAAANFSNTVMAVIDPICNSWTTGSGGPTCGMRPWESPRPGSGVPDSNMTTGMTELAAAGVMQLGYVSTYFGAQTLADVQGQIDLYASGTYTPYISGIFFDEVDRYEDIAYYNAIAAYAYTKTMSYVVFNLNGWDQHAVEYFSTPTVNLGVLFEGYPADWATYLSPLGTPPAWMADYDRTSFAMILLDTSAGNLTARLQEAYDRNYGVVFVTDAASYTAAYDTSPAYLPTEVAAWYAHIGTAAPTATTGPTATAGLYLSPTPTPPITATGAPSGTPSPTRTPTATHTAFPQATVWAPGEADAPEGFTAYAAAGAVTGIITTTASFVSGLSAWEWRAGDGGGFPAGWMRNTWAVPTAYVAYAATPDKSLLFSFDIQMVETPTAAKIELLSEWSGGSAGAMILSYSKGLTLPWQLTTEDGGGRYDWAMTDGAWHRVDIYADQQVAGYAATKTPEAGELPFRLKVDGTPIPTPTGAPPSWAADAFAWDGWKWYYINDGPFMFRTDNISLSIGDCDGSCITPTPAPVPMAPLWPELACPALAVTVDGATTEWSAVVPYTLTLATAGYSWPITPTVPAGLTGVYRCAHSGALLYLSGVITDATVVSPTGTLENGDAARVVLDGLADGDFRHLLDDHDVLIGSNGAVRDFEFYPIGATAVVSATASGWQWELSIPLATLEASTATGAVVGLTFGYHDSEGGATWAHVLTGEKRAGRLE
jgi:hypothetical protein